MVQLRPVNFFSYSPSLPPSPSSFLSLTHTQTHTQAHQTDGTEHVDLTAGNCRAQQVQSVCVCLCVLVCVRVWPQRAPDSWPERQAKVCVCVCVMGWH